MRNFLIKSAIFLALCGLLDFGLGKIFGYLTVHATGGYTKRDNFISDEVDANILIFGSSLRPFDIVRFIGHELL